jgi:hypothetical protein
MSNYNGINSTSDSSLIEMMDNPKCVAPMAKWKKIMLFIYAAIHELAGIFAVFCSIKINGQFKLLPVISAFLFPYPYIGYAMVKQRGLIFPRSGSSGEMGESSD